MIILLASLIYLKSTEPLTSPHSTACVSVIHTKNYARHNIFIPTPNQVHHFHYQATTPALFSSSGQAAFATFIPTLIRVILDIFIPTPDRMRRRRPHTKLRVPRISQRHIKCATVFHSLSPPSPAKPHPPLSYPRHTACSTVIAPIKAVFLR